MNSKLITTRFGCSGLFSILYTYPRYIFCIFIYFLFDGGCLFISSGPYFWCLEKIRIHVFFVLVSSRVFVCCSACSYIQQISGVLHKVFMEKQNPGHHQYLKTMAKTTLYLYLYLHIGGYFCLVSIVDLQSNCF